MTAVSRQDTSGVSAPKGAGTPAPFQQMLQISTEAIEALELPAVLALVGSGAAGPLGRDRILARRPSGNLDLVRRELATVGEAMELLQRGEGPPVDAVPDLAETLARLQLDGSVLDAPALLALRHLFRVAIPLGRALGRLGSTAPLVAALASVPLNPKLVSRLDASLDEDGEILDTASTGLKAARRSVRTARDRLLQKLEAILQGLDQQTAAPGAAVTVREGRYVIPVRRDSRKRPRGIVHAESATQGTLFVEPTATVELGNKLRSAITEEAAEVTKVLRELTAELRPHADDLERAQEMCIGADDLFARARYALQVGGAVPRVAPSGEPLCIRTGRHPLLIGGDRSAVPFDLELAAGEYTLIISGPNTGGKTVLIKAVGLMTLLAQAGVVPPVGPGTQLAFVRRVFADIGDRQSIAANLSTFSAHVARLRTILSEADGASLVLLDEVGSGTDPVEGAALAAAALAALTGQGARTIATTHLGALKSLATEVGGIVNGSLQFDMETLAPTFRFQKGVPGRSYGLAIARRLGVSEAVLGDAEQRVPQVERTLETLLERVEGRERELESLLARSAETAARYQEDERRLAARLVDVEEREGRLRSQESANRREAKEVARRYLLQARQVVEEALARANREGESSEGDGQTAIRRMIEEEIASLHEKEESAPDKTFRDHDQEERLEVGRYVRLRGGGMGKVVDSRNDGRLVVIAGGVRMVVPAGSVQPAPEPAPVPRKGGSAFAIPDVGHEVDLRGLRLDEAEPVLLAALDAAILADHPMLRIIHGMGTGALRKQVRHILERDDRIDSFAFAPRNQGGTGVTIAELGRGK